MLIPVTFQCGSCWQANETTVDPSQGSRQRYVEDCQVCCRPMVLSVTIEGGDAFVEVVPESD